MPRCSRRSSSARSRASRGRRSRARTSARRTPSPETRGIAPRSSCSARGFVEQRLGQPEAAIELYEDGAQAGSARDGRSLGAQALHHAQKRWRDLIGVLAREAEQTRDPAVRAMAPLPRRPPARGAPRNREEAITALERALAEMPDDLLVLEELARLYEAAERLGRARRRPRATRARDRGRPAIDSRSCIGSARSRRSASRQRPTRSTFTSKRWRSSRPTVPSLQALGKLYTRHRSWSRSSRCAVDEPAHSAPRCRRTGASRAGSPSTAAAGTGRAVGEQNRNPRSSRAAAGCRALRQPADPAPRERHDDRAPSATAASAASRARRPAASAASAALRQARSREGSSSQPGRAPAPQHASISGRPSPPCASGTRAESGRSARTRPTAGAPIRRRPCHRAARIEPAPLAHQPLAAGDEHRLVFGVGEIHRLQLQQVLGDDAALDLVGAAVDRSPCAG